MIYYNKNKKETVTSAKKAKMLQKCNITAHKHLFKNVINAVIEVLASADTSYISTFDFN